MNTTKTFCQSRFEVCVERYVSQGENIYPTKPQKCLDCFSYLLLLDHDLGQADESDDKKLALTESTVEFIAFRQAKSKLKMFKSVLRLCFLLSILIGLASFHGKAEDIIDTFGLVIGGGVLCFSLRQIHKKNKRKEIIKKIKKDFNNPYANKTESLKKALKKFAGSEADTNSPPAASNTSFSVMQEIYNENVGEGITANGVKKLIKVIGTTHFLALCSLIKTIKSVKSNDINTAIDTAIDTSSILKSLDKKLEQAVTGEWKGLAIALVLVITLCLELFRFKSSKVVQTVREVLLGLFFVSQAYFVLQEWHDRATRTEGGKSCVNNLDPITTRYRKRDRLHAFLALALYALLVWAVWSEPNQMFRYINISLIGCSTLAIAGLCFKKPGFEPDECAEIRKQNMKNQWIKMFAPETQIQNN